mmetsp:Transcript_47998/g.112033  ORF Transcript_47998/g.112033 Transcript_47998/m.112033 type:complete len:245 (+) Transcript_47998:1166-1900(+)
MDLSPWHLHIYIKPGHPTQLAVSPLDRVGVHDLLRCAHSHLKLASIVTPQLTIAMRDRPRIYLETNDSESVEDVSIFMILQLQGDVVVDVILVGLVHKPYGEAFYVDAVALGDSLVLCGSRQVVNHPIDHVVIVNHGLELVLIAGVQVILAQLLASFVLLADELIWRVLDEVALKHLTKILHHHLHPFFRLAKGQCVVPEGQLRLHGGQFVDLQFYLIFWLIILRSNSWEVDGHCVPTKSSQGP